MPAPQVVTVAISGGGTDRYVSTQGFVSKSTDTPASTPFLPRITGAITYDREASCSVWQNRGSPSQRAVVSRGVVQYVNTDGALDSWLAEPMRTLTVAIRRGLATEAYDDHTHIMFAVIDRPTAPGFYTIQHALRDKGALLEIPVCNQVYGAIPAAPTLEGTPKPTGFGSMEGVPLTLVDDANLDYDLLDVAPDAIDEVTDKGVVLLASPDPDAEYEVSPAVGVFGVRRLSNPAQGGLQVAHVTTVTERLPDVIALLLGRSVISNLLGYGNTPVTPDEVDPYSIDALDSDAPYKLNWWGRDATTIASVLTQALDSFTGWWYFDRLGLLRVGRLFAPEDMSESAVLELTDINVSDGPLPRLDTAPGLSDSVGCQRNWAPYPAGSVAGVVTVEEPARAARIMGPQQVRRGVNTLHATYADAVGRDPLKTLLSDPDDAQAEADRITALYSVERYFYDNVQVNLEGSAAFELEPGDVVLLTSERFGLTGGKPLLVVAVRTSLMSSLVTLTLWGAGPDAGDF